VVGAVFHQELLLSSRRTRQFVFRWLYAAWLVVQVIGLYVMSLFAYQMTLLLYQREIDKTILVANDFTHTFLIQLFILLALATPVFTAGAITDEKSRGTLQYLLTTELTSWDIVLGKWLARTFQVGVLFLTGLPLFCFLGVFGGLRLVTLFGLAVVTVMAVLAIGAASVLASVWSKRTRDAVLGLFLVATIAFIVDWSLGSPVLSRLSPFYALEPGWTGESLASMAGRLLLVGLIWGGSTVLCLILAAWGLRPVYLRQLQEQSRPRKERWWRARRAAIGADPIRWKEDQVEGLAPLPVLRDIPSWMGIVFVFLVTVISSLAILWNHRPAELTKEELTRLVRTGQFAELGGWFSKFAPADDSFMILAVVTIFLASLVVGIRCSGTVSGEREKQTWEALLLTPLATQMLVRGKLRGIMRASYPYLRAYAIPAVGLSILGGVAAFAWTVIALPVTWLAMYYVGAAGIWCSVYSKTSWRSLLGTLGFGYVGGFLLFVITSPVMFMMSAVLFIFLQLLDQFLGTRATGVVGFGQFHKAFFISACLTLAGTFFGAAKFFLSQAEKRVADLERTRHWRDEPVRPGRLERRRKARPKFYR
jgi:ABC-type transport system involved in multi-copper enzyme maturation permease subunit